MKANELFKQIFTRNWIAKLSCLIIAIILYFLYQFQSDNNKTYSITLSLENSRGLVITAVDRPVVQAFISGKTKAVDSIKRSDIIPYLDASDGKEGLSIIPVKFKLKNKLVLSRVHIEMQPQYISATIEKIIQRTLPVSPRIEGYPAKGYVYKGYKVTPNFIAVEGPRSEVSLLDNITTEKINLDNQKDDFSLEVPLVLKGKNTRIVGQDNIVECLIYIKESQGTLKLDLPIEAFNLNNRFIIEELSEKMVSVTLEGKDKDLDFIKRNNRIKAVIDASNIRRKTKESFNIKIKNIPKEVFLTGFSPEVVTASIVKR